MKVLLVGNGLELNFQSKLWINSIIEEINVGFTDIRDENGKQKYDSIGDMLNKYYCEITAKNKNNVNYVKWLGNQDVTKIFNIINGENKGKSLEDIFNEVDFAINDKEKVSKLKYMLVYYINSVSDEIDLDKPSQKLGKFVKTILQFNLDKYDLILTTNYTQFIERMVPDMVGKIAHIHGGFKYDKENVLLGNDKIDRDVTESYIRNKIYEAFSRNSNLWYPNSRKIELSIYGWSARNDDYLLETVIRTLVEYTFENASKNMDKFDFSMFYDAYRGNLSNMIKINYYYYSEDDLNSIEQWNKKHKWGARDFEAVSLTNSLTPNWYDDWISILRHKTTIWKINGVENDTKQVEGLLNVSELFFNINIKPYDLFFKDLYNENIFWLERKYNKSDFINVPQAEDLIESIGLGLKNNSYTSHTAPAARKELKKLQDFINHVNTIY